MNKIDNLELMTLPERPNAPVQLALPLPVKSEKPLTELQKKQRANFEAVCAEMRAEAVLFLAIANEAYPEANYTALRDMPTEHIKECRARLEVHPDFNPGPTKVPYPEIVPDYRAEAKKLFPGDAEPSAKKPRPYQPWSWQRRTQYSCFNMKKRFQKRYSIGELWIDKAQAKILEDPWRYGCCPLPSEGECIIPDPDRILIRQRAIQKEIELREKGIRY